MASVVIGAAYGDEGKGQTVHSLATPHSTVVRFNGGCQAGHTVRHEGQRHVFSHIGSGTFNGAATHLSRFFVCHPAAFLAEWHTLGANGIAPRVSVSPDCLVTTIYDVILNRMIEFHRSGGRHGSVGAGFGETIERNQMLRYSATIQDVLSGDLLDLLQSIREEWVPWRCSQLGIDPRIYTAWNAMLANDDVLKQALHDSSEFLKHVAVRDDEDVLAEAADVVFEGAQGLLLDQDYGQFPYVTHSNTGIKNVRSLMGDAPLAVYYVTRAYTTRHGAGPLPFELLAAPYAGISDDTNVTNAWQGALRFSYLNLDDVGAAVRHDRQSLSPGSEAYSIVTCLDQLPADCRVIEGGRVAEYKTGRLPQLVAEVFDRDLLGSPAAHSLSVEKP